MTYQTLSSSTFALSAGTHVLKLVMDTIGNNGAVAELQAGCKVTPAAMPVGADGTCVDCRVGQRA